MKKSRYTNYKVIVHFTLYILHSFYIPHAFTLVIFFNAFPLRSFDRAGPAKGEEEKFLRRTISLPRYTEWRHRLRSLLSRFLGVGRLAIAGTSYRRKCKMYNVKCTMKSNPQLQLQGITEHNHLIHPPHYQSHSTFYIVHSTFLPPLSAERHHEAENVEEEIEDIEVQGEGEQERRLAE